MAFIIVPNTLSAELRYEYAGEECENTLYFQKTTGWTPSEMASFGSDLMLWWSDNLKPLQGVNCIMREIYLRDLSSATGWAVTVTPVGSGAGTAPGDPHPSNVSLSVSFRSDRAGRSYRGRNYTLGMTDAHTTQSTASSVYIDAIEAAYNELPTVATNHDAIWSIVSRYTNGAPRAQGIATAVVQALVVDSTTDSQRNRLPGRGA